YDCADKQQCGSGGDLQGAFGPDPTPDLRMPAMLQRRGDRRARRLPAGRVALRGGGLLPVRPDAIHHLASPEGTPARRARPDREARALDLLLGEPRRAGAHPRVPRPLARWQPARRGRSSVLPVTVKGETMSKIHLSLNVRDLTRSVAFYEAFLGVAPHKVRPGYT